ncbi:pseudohemocyanin-2-like [Panulirus ornatus]|uniref:pseudohemocyanin-2-like n=1 Tax=Panulirus ornatus TaxID=150431 RepID=UPI003A886235
MKVLVLFALVAAAAAWPSFDGFQADEPAPEAPAAPPAPEAPAEPAAPEQPAKPAIIVDVPAAQRQRDLNHLLHKLFDPLHDERLRTLAETFDPEADLTLYADGGVAIQKLMAELKADRLEKKGRIVTALTTHDREQAIILFEVLMNCINWETAISNAAYFRERANEGQFLYAVVAAVKHSPLGEHLVLPPVYEIAPHFYADTRVIIEAYKARMAATPALIKMGFTGTKRNPEQKVAYFTEDIGLSTHYLNWHMEYPFWWRDTYGPHLARKGEIFFWIHHQLNNRFDAERICNHLGISEPLAVDKPLKEGFAPQIAYKNGVPFPSRPDDFVLVDVDGLPTIHELELKEKRILDAIDHGYLTAKDGSAINIRNERGIALLGDVIESSLYSPNPEFYGSLNNMAHKVIARQADPHGKFGIPPSVMEHYMGAVRDPSFYKLHKRIDNVFRKHKDSLPPYTREELILPGVAINNVAIDGALETYLEDYPVSLLNTFDDRAEVDAAEIDTYVPRLRHKEFSYNLDIINNNEAEVMATIRIMAWPLRDSNGVELSFEEGRWHAIELDKFWRSLVPGENHVIRKSTEASVTVPDVPSAKTLFTMTEEAIAAGTELHLEQFESATGLPNRLLIPKGNAAGVEFMLVVAATDGAADAAIEGLPTMTKFHHLGVKGVLPDRKPLGYPLDRRVPDERVFREIPNFRETIVKVYNYGEHIHLN